MADLPIDIRIAEAGDHGLLAEIGARTFGEAFANDNTPEDMAAYLAASFSPAVQAAELAEPGTTFLVAEVEDEAVGYARLREGPAPDCVDADRPIEIVRFYSIASWIGHGVGAALMSACLDQAPRRGRDVIWLDVWERNARAIALYRRWGFAEVGTQPFVLGSDVQRDLLMARAVPPDVTASQGQQ